MESVDGLRPPSLPTGPTKTAEVSSKVSFMRAIPSRFHWTMWCPKKPGPAQVDMQPAGKYLGEDYSRAGGLPAGMHELFKAGRIHGDANTINGKTMAENVRRAKVQNSDVIRPYAKPMKKQAGFRVLKGNLFASAIMKTSVVSDEFRKRYLSNPKNLNAFEGRAVVFEGPEDYHHRIENPSLKIDENTLLVIR